MTDLRVDTDALRATARELGGAAAAASAVAEGGRRAESMAAGLGRPDAIQAARRFLSAWTYGLRWIAAQAADLAADLVTTAEAFEAIERTLADAASGTGAVGTPCVPMSPRSSDWPVGPGPSRSSWTGGATAPPVQLSAAPHPTQLIPGDVAEASLLARTVTRFADEAGQARFAVATSSLGSWTGAAARVTEVEFGRLSNRLAAAEMAFEDAGAALRRYETTLEDAQIRAAKALAMWNEAEHASAVARGAAVGVDAAARALVHALDAAAEGTPKDPGLLARFRRFATGAAEGVFGMGTGAVELAALAWRLLPTRAIWDPHGYTASWEAVGAGLIDAVRNPEQVGAALIDLETWRDDPFRAGGKLAPEILLALATVGAAGAARGAATTERYTSAAAAIERAQAAGTFRPPIREATVTARLRELGLTRDSVQAHAVRAQLAPPYGNVDRWVPVRLEEGQRFAFTQGGVLTPVHGELPRDARAFHESLQIEPTRAMRADGSNSDPDYEPSVAIVEVRGGSIDAASAVAAANTQFGSGGAVAIRTPDVLADLGTRLHIVGEHSFDPGSLRARFEDPRYREADPSLPVEPLDPGREAVRGLREEGIEQAREKAVGAAKATGVAIASDSVDEGAQ